MAWVMLPRGAEWRYGYDATRMPWYPQARLFRQHTDGAWDGVVSRIVEELRAAFAA